jgi:hypothetical protein
MRLEVELIALLGEAMTIRGAIYARVSVSGSDLLWRIALTEPLPYSNRPAFRKPLHARSRKCLKARGRTSPYFGFRK